MSQAARTILDNYRFQWSLSGALPWRLFYASSYWTLAIGAKKLWTGGDWSRAHALALRVLSKAGLTHRGVRVSTPDGLDLEMDLFTCFLILKELYADGVYEPRGVEGFIPQPGQVVFDVGAQQGLFSLLAARKVGPRGKVVSMEPEPSNYARLSRNIAANRLAQSLAFQVAVSDHSGTTILYTHPFNTGGHSLMRISSSDSAAQTKVSLVTLDGLSRETGLEPDLIKIDVEGSVLPVIRGGMDLIRRKRPALIIEKDSPEETAVLTGLLAPLGYTWQERDTNLFAKPA